MRRLLLLVAVVAAAVPAAAGASTVSATSTNWSGYAVRRAGVTFRHVSATWTVPAVDCASGDETYSASWVGIGGYATTSQALEQLGTESDCGRDGAPDYTAWFEVVPDAATNARITIRPGDVVHASTAVRGTLVTLKLSDLTRRTSQTRTIRAKAVDLSSAEWIVEAPSLCHGLTADTCHATSLANFGTTAFAGASATSGGGHTGTILDAAWTPIAISLSSEDGHGGGAGGPGGWWGPGRGRGLDAVRGGTAAPGVPSADGSGFSVAYAAPGSSTGAPSTTTPASTTVPASTAGLMRR
jgi:hypothetical protein